MIVEHRVLNYGVLDDKDLETVLDELVYDGNVIVAVLTVSDKSWFSPTSNYKIIYRKKEV